MCKSIDNSLYDEAHFMARRKKFSKKHGDEVASAFINWKNTMAFFEHSNVEQVRGSGLVRCESNGVLAADQRGSDKNPPHPIRLYFFLTEDAQGKHCILLTLGDKDTQQGDNNFCAKALRKLKLK